MPLIDAVYVSTDDDEIAEVARQYGAQVPYRRPAELASDQAAKIPAIEHLVDASRNRARDSDRSRSAADFAAAQHRDLSAAIAHGQRAGLTWSLR